MEGRVEQFMANAAEALQMKMVGCAQDLDDDSLGFKPEFTHQVFEQSDEGVELKIFGYRNLQIQLYYTAAHLNVYLNLKCDERYDAGADGAEPDDVIKTIQKWLPKDESGEKARCTSSLDEFQDMLQQEESFKPLGEMVHRFEGEKGKGSTDVYMYDGTTPGAVEYHEKTMFFLIWFIDGANYIDLRDPNWKVFTLYQRTETADGGERYAYMGMLTLYEYFTSATRPQKGVVVEKRRPLADLALDCSTERNTYLRPRISQMLILPPFQKKGHGAHLLQSVYDHCYANSKVVDIAVEDPSDGFSMLRDIVDARNCLARIPNAAEFFSYTAHYSAAVEAVIKDTLKLSSLQCRRVFEIVQRHLLKAGDDEQARHYRLRIKKRLIQPYVREKKFASRFQKILKQEELDILQQKDEENKRQMGVEYANLMMTYDDVIDRIR